MYYCVVLIYDSTLYAQQIYNINWLSQKVGLKNRQCYPYGLLDIKKHQQNSAGVIVGVQALLHRHSLTAWCTAGTTTTATGTATEALAHSITLLLLHFQVLLILLGIENLLHLFVTHLLALLLQLHHSLHLFLARLHTLWSLTLGTHLLHAGAAGIHAVLHCERIGIVDEENGLQLNAVELQRLMQAHCLALRHLLGVELTLLALWST